YTKTPLHVAAEAGNLETATLLLAAGADPTAEWEEEFYQPLHLAASNNHLAMVTLLLDHGAPIDSSNGFEGYSENALHHACRDGRLDMIELLLARGAALGSYGDCGTPLGVAVHRCQLEVARLLLQEGADVGA
ncbi:ankyrin repeat protein, partial [Mycena vulgaris]